MKISKKTLLDLLEDKPNSLYDLSPIQLAHLYVNSALLVTVMDFIKDQLWLENNKKIGTTYKDFITPFFKEDLISIDFLQEFLVLSGASDIKTILKVAKEIELKTLNIVVKASKDDHKVFLIQTLNEMKTKYLLEEFNQEGLDINSVHVGLNLYKTFDNLDIIFDLNYQLDTDMVVDFETDERLYQKSGVGVQSGYSTIILALNAIDIKPGTKMIDLGSGYGRVGLVCSLIRTDIEFIGFEYVPHRVEISNKACLDLGLQDTLNFQTQDLSSESFIIPEADVYYMYDPFSKDTYKSVLKQIVDISKRKDITVVTKGNGRGLLEELSSENSWAMPILIDEGNLCIFRSFI
jgi:precorrin-6B methylase 2